ncbi:hypothetical protein FAIPA1_20082 [Frankia sp. AiPs1]
MTAARSAADRARTGDRRRAVRGRFRRSPFLPSVTSAGAPQAPVVGILLPDRIGNGLMTSRRYGVVRPAPRSGRTPG